MRINKNWVLLIIFAFSMWWTISLFIVPFMIPANAVRNLHGESNIIDYGPLWNTLSPYPRVIYYIGDLNCHQISNRTIYLNGNEMPVCARCTSIFVFVSVGLFTAFLTKPSESISEGVLNLFPKKFRDHIQKHKYGPMLFVIALFILLLFPTAIDGFRQLLTNYESTNPLRILTGAPCGFAGGFYLGVMMTTVSEIDKEAKEIAEKPSS